MTKRIFHPICLLVASSMALLGCVSVARESDNFFLEVEEKSDSSGGLISEIAPELRASAEDLLTTTLDASGLVSLRAMLTAHQYKVPPTVKEIQIEGLGSAPPVTLFVEDPAPDTKFKPAYVYLHGGGFVSGNARATAAQLPAYADACDCVVISVDYRLAPETSFPGPLEDAISALRWVHLNSKQLGVDPNRIAIGGASAGAGLAAQLAIAARDRSLPVAFQLLIYPMLDDRTGVNGQDNSKNHYVGWTGGSNQFAWTAYLGQSAGLKDVPYGAVPARVEDLGDLPPAWIGVGTADLFVDEDRDYAERLEQFGIPVELLLVPGAYHGFDLHAPASNLAKSFTRAWKSALYRALHTPVPRPSGIGR